jgi:hypothetical protein
MPMRSLHLLTALGLLSACAGGQAGPSAEADSLRRELARYSGGAVQDSAFALAALDSAAVVVVTDSVGVSDDWGLMWSAQEFRDIGESLRASIERALTDAAVRPVPRGPDTLRLTVQNGTLSPVARPTVSVWSMQLSLRRPMVLVAAPGMVTTQPVWYMNHIDVGVGRRYQPPAAAREAAGRLLDGWLTQLVAGVRAVRQDPVGGPVPQL